jgi:ribosomal protein L12E/L44/L45/RPP1/RPP2
MIVTKTDLGHQVIKDRSMQLTPRQRSALILVDGRRTMSDLQSAMTAAGIAHEELRKLMELGLVVDKEPEVTAAQQAAVASAAAAAAQHKRRTPQERYAEAYPIATRLTASLGLRGFRLNLAVEAAGNYDDLLELAPRIRDAVGAEKFTPLDNALNDR